MNRRTLIAALLFAQLLPCALEAKGRFARVSIVEDGSTTEILVTDPELTDFFAFSRFPKQRLSPSPKPAGRAFVVTRGDYTPDSVYHAFDRLHYYPPQSPCAPGLVYYDGLVSGWSEYDHQWYSASADGDRAMARFIASHPPAAKSPAHIPNLPPNPSLQRTRQKRRAAELEYR